MKNTDVDNIVNDLVYEALTGGPRNSVTGGDSQRAYLANELVAGSAAFAHSVPGGVFSDLNNMINDQVGKLGVTTAGAVQEGMDTVGYLIQALKENDLDTVARVLEEVCNDPLEEDADNLHELATELKNSNVNTFFVKQIHRFAEDVRNFGQLNEAGYDINYYVNTGKLQLLEATAPTTDETDEADPTNDETDAADAK